MNELLDWLQEIGPTAKIVAVKVEELECGEYCKCAICGRPADVSSADPEPCNGYGGYIRAVNISVLLYHPN